MLSAALLNRLFCASIVYHLSLRSLFLRLSLHSLFLYKVFVGIVDWLILTQICEGVKLRFTKDATIILGFGLVLDHFALLGLLNGFLLLLIDEVVKIHRLGFVAFWRHILILYLC